MSSLILKDKLMISSQEVTVFFAYTIHNLFVVINKEEY